jgi:hypothetical protein
VKRNTPHLTLRVAPPFREREPAEAEIRKEAYFLWIERGRPEGLDLEIWDAARARLLHRSGTGHAHAHQLVPTFVRR